MRESELRAVFAQRADQFAAFVVGNIRQRGAAAGREVIRLAEDFFRMPNLVTFGAQMIKRMKRRGVGQYQPVYKEQHFAAVFILGDRVVVPYFLEHRP